jgi:Mn2+/Fe2+ NRAMP family transporter
MGQVTDVGRARERHAQKPRLTANGRLVQFLALLWLALGPGLIALMADNDAGGVLSYTVTGATFGAGFFVPLVLCLGAVTFTVQEMSMRLGAVTGRGYTELVFQRYGRVWGFYHMAALVAENLLVLVTEFIGMTAGFAYAGLPLWLADSFCLLLVGGIAVMTGYAAKERLAMMVGFTNVAFIAVLVLEHPAGAALLRSVATWRLPPSVGTALVLWYVVATIGNAVAPWMVFFQGSAVIDKGGAARELAVSRLDTLVGAVVQVLVAAVVILAGAALFGHVQGLASAGPATLMAVLGARFGPVVPILFAVGLFGAGFLAAITISFSSSWSVAESFQWTHSLNDGVRRAPRFYAVYLGSLVIAALVILWPHLPFDFMAVLAQIIGGVLMVPTLVFLVLLTDDATLMGSERNVGWRRIWAWSIVGVLASLSLLGVWATLASWLH